MATRHRATANATPRASSSHQVARQATRSAHGSSMVRCKSFAKQSIDPCKCIEPRAAAAYQGLPGVSSTMQDGWTPCRARPPCREARYRPPEFVPSSMKYHQHGLSTVQRAFFRKRPLGRGFRRHPLRTRQWFSRGAQRSLSAIGSGGNFCCSLKDMSVGGFVLNGCPTSLNCGQGPGTYVRT